MKIGVFSDVHGNLEGLNQALLSMAREGVTQCWCLGDIVGYGANPNECIARVREKADAVIMGNHDAACAGLEDATGFNLYAREAVAWTSSRLTEENRGWLSKLPLTLAIGDALPVHGPPFDPPGWHYVSSGAEIQKAFDSTEARLILVGHSHHPGLLECRGNNCHPCKDSMLKMKPGSRYLANAGSTGQPRDGDARASYVIFDDADQSLSMIRVQYNVSRTQRKIIEAGLPRILAGRLETGT